MNENAADVDRSHPKLGNLRAVRQAIRTLVRLLLVTAAGLGTSGFAHAVAQPVEHESPEAATAARAIISDSPDGLTLPPRFEEVMGYRPVGGVVLMDPEGACSTPLGHSPATFEQACRVHDLGYDMLRYAEHTGGRLGPWARFGTDRRLYRDLRRTCETAGCRAQSTLYFAALTANSVRQGYRAPTDEPLLPWVLAALAVVTAALGQPVVARRLKNPPSLTYHQRHAQHHPRHRRRLLVPAGALDAGRRDRHRPHRRDAGRAARSSRNADRR